MRLAIERRPGSGLAVLLGCALHSFTHSSPALYFLWATVISIEIAEATFKSQDLGHWGNLLGLHPTSTGECRGASHMGHSNLDCEAYLFIFYKSPHLSNSEI